MSFITQGQSGLVINLEGKSQEILIYLNQKDFFQRYLLNTILGGQFTSRINLNLRERNGSYTKKRFNWKYILC